VSSDSSQTIASDIELVPGNCFAPLDFESIYGRTAAVEVDLGCGDGLFLAALATENADRDFLGVERLRGRIRSACRKIERNGLTNARVMQFEIPYVVEHLLPPNSVAAFHLMFPDPWPKRRHASRRVISENLLVSLYQALRGNGTVRIATDESEYFRQITQLALRSPLFAVNPDPDWTGPATRFEQRFRERGLEIHRLELRKVSPLT
jgi:tRNA (guanine-N7-)-methyltransferase